MDTKLRSMIEQLLDPVAMAEIRNGVRLRSYQAEALREVYQGALRHNGESYAVIMPRQSGKNETQAQLECALLLANQDRGGTIVKVIPTAKTQGRISRERLEQILEKGSETDGLHPERDGKDRTVFGNTSIRYMSAAPGASVIGATADILLEVDEAQSVSIGKFDRDAAPMAASTNAARVFWGTVWDEHTLLARAYREALPKGRAFLTDAVRVGKEVPAYADFVREQVALLGRDHPTVRTQYFCEEIGDLTGMFSAERIAGMRGTHRPQDVPDADGCIVFLIDIAGSDEMSVKSRTEQGFGDRRDATVLTICEVCPPEAPGGGPVWKVRARRYYRNLPAARLEEEVSAEFLRWDPRRAVLDHTGLGCLLSDYLNRRFPGVVSAYDITAANKSRMAWEFLAMTGNGRWQEYAADELSTEESPFDPARDRFEILSDPALLQRMFFRELRACRISPSADGNQVRWGVPEGTRDPASGRLIHDDLVLSAALSVFEDRDIPFYTDFDGDLPLPCSFDDPIL